jgi:hypothetical protein
VAPPAEGTERELRSTLEILTELVRLAQRKARHHARAGRRALAARFASHVRLMTAAIRALHAELGTDRLVPQRIRRG